MIVDAEAIITNTAGHIISIGLAILTNSTVTQGALQALIGLASHGLPVVRRCTGVAAVASGALVTASQALLAAACLQVLAVSTGDAVRALLSTVSAAGVADAAALGPGHLVPASRALSDA